MFGDCISLPFFGNMDSVLFQKMFNSTAYHITEKTWIAGKFC